MIQLIDKRAVDKLYEEYIWRVIKANKLGLESNELQEYLRRYNSKIMACLNITNGFVPQKVIENIHSLPDSVRDRIKSSRWSIKSIDDVNNLKEFVLSLPETNLERWEIISEESLLEYICETGAYVKHTSGFLIYCSHIDLLEKLHGAYIPFDSHTLRDGFC
jgi:hypothetical protein